VLKFDLNSRGLRSGLLLGAAAIVGLASPAFAQDQGGVETVVVTGSLLNRSDVETPSPVTIVTSQQIQASGLTSTGDIVRSLSADNSGSIPTAFGIGFASGSSGVALRGLTVNSTLVLINGRRTANYPLADDGERGFVDLNTIPLDAVDRIEVLKDGASSIYGADAIAGVVNIIMKDEFQGVAGEAEYGTSQHGGGTMYRLTGTLGYGDMASDHFNAYVNFEYEKDDAVRAGQRGFPFNTNDESSIGAFNLNNTTSIYGRVAPTHLTDPTDVTSGGSQLGPWQVLNGNTGAGGTCGPRSSLQNGTTDPDSGLNPTDSFCEQNLTGQYADLQLPETRYGVYAHAKERFSNAATFYMDASYFENKVSTPLGPTGVQTTVPHDTSNIAIPAYVAGVRNPNDPFAAACPALGTEGVTPCEDALLATLMPGILGSFNEDDHVLYASAGLKGVWKGWSYDTAFVAAHNWLNTDNKGFLDYGALINAVAGGTYNFIDQSANSAASLHALAPDLVKVSTSDEDSWDVRASHDLFALPGGEAQIGFSLEVRHEATFDPDLNPGLNAQGLGIAHTIGNRNIYSASAEVGLPITTNLEADLSGRFDHYSDFGDTFNPKIGIKWTPLTQIGFRGTYSTGFRAPSFSENGSSASEGFVTENPCGINPTFCTLHGNDAYTKPFALGLLSTANPAIKPEKSRNYTFGTILQPFTDWDLSGTVDYYNIKKTSVISPPSPGAAIGPAFGLGALPAGYTVTYAAPDPNCTTAACAAALLPSVIGAPYINASGETTSGIDVNVHLGTDLGSGIHWTSEVEFTQVFEFKFTPGAAAPGVTLNYVGTAAPFELSSSGGTPRNKGSWANTITWGPLDVTGTLHYTDGFREAIVDATFSRSCFTVFTPTTPQFCNLKSFYDFDLTARYHATDNVDIFGGIRNLFDQKAPLATDNYGSLCTCYDPTYDQDGAIGRFFTIGVAYKD
jgi:iron complex outermembrane receptor protein